ncbi:transport and Golgi organization protein 1 homolog isoform X1 [Podarcis raffonei]|uniref:transport and Golgi organization protein 1 homolog isoform X1 n=1 Tax=Podarcis raffonei TaxID=65483 RepID=UPI0023294954|nr:transport and Golgi organization protein 1 homolog isoform X1 [Podarcis raffonei]
MAAAARRRPLALPPWRMLLPPPLLLLLLCAQLPPCVQSGGAPDRRFAEWKRCADPECSMLMCRGKAVKDFKGPDCRFVDFKEGESVYVYYKLTGRTHELWAGSVGNEFGYFPKDLLEINHIYTYEELELPTDETDFVCFNGGKDDFENYNAEELLKLSEDMVASDAEAQLETEKEEETEAAEHTESVEPEIDGSEVGSEVDSEDHAKMGQKDNFIFENNENVEGALDSESKDLTVNSNTDNPQGDQSAHQPSEEMLQETLKVPKYESAKNSTVSQGKAKQSDNGGEDDGTDTLLRQHEVLEDLKTTLGSTADALVSDDETTSLVTPLDDDFSEDLGIDSYDTEKLEEPEEQSKEIPLLSFTEETKSSEDPEAEETPSDGVFESETSDYDEGIAEAAGRFVHEKKDDSSLLTNLGDKFFAIVSGGERTVDETDGDKEEEEEDDEDNDEVVLISKKENTDVLADSESSAEDDSITPENDQITKKIHNVDVGDPKGEKHETPDYEEEYSKAEVEPTIEELQSTSTHDFGAFSNYGGGRQPKASMGAKEKHLKPPLGDIKDDPEGLSLHKIIKEKETRDGHIEDSLENDTKHKTLWEKIGKKDGDGKQPMNIVPHLVEELTNESQPELGASDLLEGKTKQDGEDFELGKVLSNTKQSNDSAMESIPTEEDTEVPIVQSEQETVTQDLKKEEEEKKLIIEKSPQVTQHRNLTQQNTEELKPVELDAEEDDFLEVLEEELLQDENAVSAKLSKERLADEQSFTSEAESGTTQLQMPNGAISRAANPADAIGEEAITTLEQAKKDGMEDWNEAQEGIQINKDSQLSERKEIKEENQEEVEPQVKNSLLQEKTQYIHDKIMSNKINTSELENKSDLHEELQTSTEHQHSSDDFGPQEVSEKTNEAAEPEYSESVRQLNIMKEFLDEKRIARIQKYLGPQHIFRIESLFHDLELELMFAQKHADNHADPEEALDRILESSESNILDVLNKVLDSREAENKEEVIKEIDLFDDEAALMDDIQELMYSLRQKYSPVSESAPLASLPESGMDSSESVTANAKETEHDRHSIESPVENPDEELPRDLEQMSTAKEEIIHPDQPKEHRDILEKTGTSDETEIKGVLDSDKVLPIADTTLISIDSGMETDIVPGIINAKDDVTEESSNPSDADSTAPHITAALDSAILSAKENMRPFTELLVSTLPEDMQPGPDFHGLPWEPIIITAFVGFATLAIFLWRTCLSVKSRMYQVTEKQLVEKIKTLLKEKTEILEKMSEYDQKIKAAKEAVNEAQKQNTNLSDEATGLKDTIRGLKETNHLLDERVKKLHTMLETEKEHYSEKQKQLTEAQKSLENFQEIITLHSVELSEVQIALNEAKLSEEKVKSELSRIQEENTRLKKSKEQLLQQAEGWSERHSELSEQIKLYQKSQNDMEEALAYKENEIEVLTNCIMQLKQLDAESESEGKRDDGNDLANGELSDTRNEKMKNQIKQMMDVSRVKTTLSIIEEERDHMRSKLNDEVAARHELEEQIKKLEHDSCSLQRAKSQLESECKTLQQKVEILNELYQQKEMALQKKLSQEEYERQEKDQKLSAADEKAVLAVEDVKKYKKRIDEIVEELQQTERSYKNQIDIHEKKAHENWLIARSAERALAEEKRENSNLRLKLIEMDQKIAALQRPLIVKPTAGRPDHQAPPRRGPLSRDGSFGPSPVSGGAPSPPLMMEPLGRPLSANPREGSRELGPAVASLMTCGPRTSSPAAVVDGMPNPPKEPEAPCVSTAPPSSVEATAVNMGPKGPPPYPGAPVMGPPAAGHLPPPPVRVGLPPRLPYGPRPLPLVRGAPPPPLPRDYPPVPPFGMRDFPHGPLPPPDQRGYQRGPPPFRPPYPRDYPPGPPRLPPQGLRDYPPPPARDLPPSGPNDYQGGPSGPPSPASSRDSAHHAEEKP